MRLLLDSHALIWWFAGDPQLSVPALRAVEDEENNVLVSAASAWEIATKHRIGKLPEALARDFTGTIPARTLRSCP